MSIIWLLVGAAIAVLAVPPTLQEKAQKASRRVVRQLVTKATKVAQSTETKEEE